MLTTQLPVYGSTGFSLKSSSLSPSTHFDPLSWVLFWCDSQGVCEAPFYLSAGLHTIIWLHLRQEWLNSTWAPNLLDPCLPLLASSWCLKVRPSCLCKSVQTLYRTASLIFNFWGEFLRPHSHWNLQIFHWSWKTHKENKILALSYQGRAARGCEVDWFLIYSEWQPPFFACRGVNGLRARIRSLFSLFTDGRLVCFCRCKIVAKSHFPTAPSKAFGVTVKSLIIIYSACFQPQPCFLMKQQKNQWKWRLKGEDKHAPMTACWGERGCVLWWVFRCTSAPLLQFPVTLLRCNH